MSQYVVTLSNGRSVRQFADNKLAAYLGSKQRLLQGGTGVTVVNVARYEA